MAYIPVHFARKNNHYKKKLSGITLAARTSRHICGTTVEVFFGFRGSDSLFFYVEGDKCCCGFEDRKDAECGAEAYLCEKLMHQGVVL